VRERILSNGRQIAVDVYRPASSGPHLALVVLHGSGGVRDFSAYAHSMAMHGYAIFVPHYFETTGTMWADAHSIGKHALTWSAAVVDTITFAAKQPFVDADRIALLGFSLGGYIAVGVASQDQRVKAVVEFFGGLPHPIAPFMQRLPPTLILHGEADPVVPIGEALRLRQFCQERNVCFEIHTFPGVGHGFTDETMQVATARTLRFLDQHVKAKQAA
jgi:dienelactone hydrolase